MDYWEQPERVAVGAMVELDDSLRKGTSYKNSRMLGDYLGNWAREIREGRGLMEDVALGQLVGDFLWPSLNPRERLKNVGTRESLAIGLEMISEDLLNVERLRPEEIRGYLHFAVLAARAFSREPFSTAYLRRDFAA